MRDDELYIAMLDRAGVPHTLEEKTDERGVTVAVEHSSDTNLVRGYSGFSQTHVFVRSDGNLSRVEIWE